MPVIVLYDNPIHICIIIGGDIKSMILVPGARIIFRGSVAKTLPGSRLPESRAGGWGRTTFSVGVE
jgi:hypothetical protein